MNAHPQLTDPMREWMRQYPPTALLWQFIHDLRQQFNLTPEEADAWHDATAGNAVDRIFLVAPSSTDERIRTVAGASSGFLYAASTMGVTGARASTSDLAGPLVARTRAAIDQQGTGLPVGVGLGVSNGAQAAEVAAYADGVIVGSAFVRCLLDHADDRATGVKALRTLTEDLARGVRARA